MKDARGQLDAMKNWTAGVHGDIFSRWTYVCVVALPSTSSSSLQSQNNPFIITKEIIESGLHRWFDNLMSICEPHLNPVLDSTAYMSYQEFMKRSVGLSRLDNDLRLAKNEYLLKIIIF